MKRVYKDQKMVGKLSTRKIPFGDPFIDKKVSAVLPAVRNHSKNRLSNSAFLFEGKQDPLPYIKPGVKPLSRTNKNPEENEIFYVDGSKGKIGHCISTQMNSPRHAHAGKLYNPSSQIFASPGKIRHVASSEPKGAHLQKTIKQFKNFLNHSYLQEVQTSRSRINIQEFDYKFRDSAIASSSQFQNQMKQSRYSREMQNQSAYYEQKPFYLSTNSMKTSDITLKNQREFYARSKQSKIDQHIGFTPMPLNLQQNGKDKQGIVVSMQMPVSRIKRMLIEEDSSVQLFFNISRVLMEELSVSILQRQIHSRALSIFEQMMMFKPQIVSLKRFSNCILLIANHPTVNENKTTLLWSYDGSFYLGGWVQSKKSEGSKQGLGLQFLNNAIYFGEFENNRYQGFGILKKTSNQIYVGQWSQGEKHGWGKVFDEKGSLCLDGNFQNGSYCGSRTQAK